MESSRSKLETFSGLLEVKYSESFTDQYFNEHPYRYNLLGLSKMLTDYGVENGVTQIIDKEQDISEIVTLFIAQFGGVFVTVYKVESTQVSFIWYVVSVLKPYRENKLSGKSKEKVTTLNENKDNNVFMLVHFKE